MTANNTLLVHIEKPIYGGNFLARHEGKAIFVPQTLPGEEACVRITEDKRSFSTAALEEITVLSPERIAPACPHYGPCGGCHYQHTNYTSQLNFKQQILLETFDRGKVTLPDQIDILSADPWHYRNRIRLAFDAQGRIGYRSHASHAIIPIDACPIAAPSLIKVAQSVAEILRKTTPKPPLSELALFTNADETQLLLTLVLASPSKFRFEAFAEALHQQIPTLCGAELVLAAREKQPQRTLARWGVESLHYTAAGFSYRVDHGAFFQVNRHLIDPLVDRVTANRSGKLAWDLFAGVGLFARQLTSHFETVIAVESAPFATRALEANLTNTQSKSISAATLDFLRNNRKSQRPDPIPDLIVVDPPRAGLGPEVTAELIRVAASEIIYVSCDPATLARDLRTLTASGYAIASVTLADLFPQTFHIETIAVLHRASSI